MGDFSIEVMDVSKNFRLYSERRQTLRERFVRGASKYHEFCALRDINLQIERGSTFGLIGHNGSGKSTLLKLIAGVHRPSSGTITTRGRISALLELGAGFHPELTGRDNVYLNAAILGIGRRQIDAAMDEIIDFSGLGEFIDSPVKVYSSGMVVRLGFSISVQIDPEILIVDEIIAVGDEEFQRKCMDHAFELHRRGTTIVLVSHSLQAVRELCDHGAWIDHGRQVATGEIGDVVDAYMTSVNAQEAAAASGSEPDGEHAANGSGEIRLTDFALLDERGQQVGFGVSGRPLTLRLQYFATRSEPNAELTIEIAQETGGQVASLESTNNRITISPGTGHIEFTVDRLPLQAGNFLISAKLSALGHTYDSHDRSHVFKVRSADGRLGSGVVDIYGAWSHAPQ